MTCKAAHIRVRAHLLLHRMVHLRYHFFKCFLKLCSAHNGCVHTNRINWILVSSVLRKRLGPAEWKHPQIIDSWDRCHVCFSRAFGPTTATTKTAVCLSENCCIWLFSGCISCNYMHLSLLVDINTLSTWTGESAENYHLTINPFNALALLSSSKLLHCCGSTRATFPDLSGCSASRLLSQAFLKMTAKTIQTDASVQSITMNSLLPAQIRSSDVPPYADWAALPPTKPKPPLTEHSWQSPPPLSQYVLISLAGTEPGGLYIKQVRRGDTWECVQLYHFFSTLLLLLLPPPPVEIVCTLKGAGREFLMPDLSRVQASRCFEFLKRNHLTSKMCL